MLAVGRELRELSGEKEVDRRDLLRGSWVSASASECGAEAAILRQRAISSMWRIWKMVTELRTMTTEFSQDGLLAKAMT